MQLLWEITREAEAASTTSQAIAAVLESVCGLAGWPVGHAYTIAVDGTEHLVSTTLWHLQDPRRFATFRKVTEAIRYAPGSGLSGRVLVTGKHAWTTDLAAEPAVRRTRAAREAGIEAAFGFPVVLGGRVELVLEFFSVISLEPPDPIVELVAQIARRLGPSLDRIRSLEHLNALVEVNQRIASSLEPDTVLENIVANAVRLSGSSGGLLYEYADSTQTFHLKASYRIETEIVELLEGAAVPFGEGVVGHAALLGAPVQLPDILTPVPFASPVWTTVRRLGYRAALGLPLTLRDQLLGGLVVWRRTPGGFSPTVVELLGAFATQSALSLHNARIHRQLREKNAQLELVDFRKTRFLAHMSHELRTPLTSVLMLSELLAANSDRNLTAAQVEYAETIHGSGKVLLELVDDLLDLARIEAGTATVNVGTVAFADVCRTLDRGFREAAKAKRLGFAVEVEPGTPVAMRTGQAQVLQILRNLLANAVKYTDTGSVTLRVGIARGGWTPDHATLGRASAVVAFSVVDTGIGIPADEHEDIFAPFRQSSGAMARPRGGTGLGLAISREMSALLGGQLRLESALGQGSTFTLYLPLSLAEPAETAPPQAARTLAPPVRLPRSAAANSTTSRAAPLPVVPLADADGLGNRVLLVVGGADLARLLAEEARAGVSARLVTTTAARALADARAFAPAAVILDLRLPARSGWLALDQLRRAPDLRHVPVLVVSNRNEVVRGLRSGAFAALDGPVTKVALDAAVADMQGFVERTGRKLLIVEPDEVRRRSIVELVGTAKVQITAVGTGVDALATLGARGFECLVLATRLPDMTGVELIGKLTGELGLGRLPIIVYAGTGLTREDETALATVTDAVVVTGILAPEHLLHEIARILHLGEADLSPEQRRVLAGARRTDLVLAGRKALIVDDDPRSLFALSQVLEGWGMQVLVAENGPDGIALLARTPEVAIVLMDLRMPGMDGYEAIRAIRALGPLETLPIVALTASAQQGKDEAAFAAGASEYLTKPVDSEWLQSVLRVLLSR